MTAEEIQKIIIDNFYQWGFTTEFHEESAKQILALNDRWISVEEKFPESDLVNCIVAFQYKVIGEKWSEGDPAKAHLTVNDDWRFFDDSLQEIYDDHRIRVTHWKPMPKSPNTES